MSHLKHSATSFKVKNSADWEYICFRTVLRTNSAHYFSKRRRSTELYNTVQCVSVHTHARTHTKVKLSLSTLRRHTGEAEVNLHLCLTSVLDGGEWCTSHGGHLTPQEWTRYPLNRRPVGPQSRCGSYFACAGIRTPDRPSSSLTTIPTERSGSVFVRCKVNTRGAKIPGC